MRAPVYLLDDQSLLRIIKRRKDSTLLRPLQACSVCVSLLKRGSDLFVCLSRIFTALLTSFFHRLEENADPKENLYMGVRLSTRILS